MELAEEARNVSVESGQSCYTEEVQSQGAGLTRPVFVTVMEYSSPVLKEGAMTAPDISIDMIPTTLSAGRRNPVDQLGLVGPQDKTEQSVLPGSDTKEVGTDPAGPVGPDVTVDQIQPVAEGPVGQYSPVGPRRMFSQCKPNRPVAVGPVGQSFTPGPVGPCGMVSNCKWMDRIAYSPVGSTVIPDPVEQTGSPIQIDFTKIVTTDRPAS